MRKLPKIKKLDGKSSFDCHPMLLFQEYHLLGMTKINKQNKNNFTEEIGFTHKHIFHISITDAILGEEWEGIKTYSSVSSSSSS